MKLKIKRNELSFFIAFSVWLIYQLLEANIYFRQFFFDYPIYRIVYLITYITLAMSILQNRVIGLSLKKFLLYVIALIGGVLAVYISEDVIFLLTLILFILTARRINFYRILEYDFKLQVFFMIFTVVLALLGVIENGYRYRGDIVRFFLGYKSTLAPMFLLHISMMFVYLKKEKLKWRHVIILLLINQFFYVESNVRAPYFYTIFLLLFAIIGKRIHLPQKKIAVNLFTLLAPILYVITISAQALYSSGNSIMISLNLLLSSRLRLGNDAIQQFGFSFFGNNINWNFVGVSGADYSYVDSAFLKYTLMYGFLVMGLIVIGYALMMRKAWMKNDIYLCIVLTFIIINAIADPQLLYLQYNPFILLLGLFLQDSRKQCMLPEYNDDVQACIDD